MIQEWEPYHIVDFQCFPKQFPSFYCKNKLNFTCLICISSLGSSTLRVTFLNSEAFATTCYISRNYYFLLLAVLCVWAILNFSLINRLWLLEFMEVYLHWISWIIYYFLFWPKANLFTKVYCLISSRGVMLRIIWVGAHTKEKYLIYFASKKIIGN